MRGDVVRLEISQVRESAHHREGPHGGGKKHLAARGAACHTVRGDALRLEISQVRESAHHREGPHGGGKKHLTARGAA